MLPAPGRRVWEPARRGDGSPTTLCGTSGFRKIGIECGPNVHQMFTRALAKITPMFCGRSRLLFEQERWQRRCTGPWVSMPKCLSSKCWRAQWVSSSIVYSTGCSHDAAQRRWHKPRDPFAPPPDGAGAPQSRRFRSVFQMLRRRASYGVRVARDLRRLPARPASR